MEADISPLRKTAARPSLATDQQLLTTLQNMHQKLISLSSETNAKLQLMMSSLDDATVALHNTNNMFMALSNRQFIESRVYEDDDVPPPADVAPTHTKVDPLDPRLMMTSLAVLEGHHETLTILADSDCSSEDEEDLTRVVLKPKELYAHRPLPHIIGSHGWTNKWHAGLIAEESNSETDSESRHSIEQYSESEHEELPAPGSRGELSTPPSVCSEAASLPISPAEVANQLAQRLRGNIEQIPQRDRDSTPEPPVVRKVYGVDKPAPATIFSDEPPPLSLSDESDTDDIFAELQRKPKDNAPYKVGNKAHNVVGDLFGQGDRFGHFLDEPPPLTNVKRNTTLKQEELEPELIEQPPPETIKSDTSKKPIGGQSLFGTNKNNESIGAAILKRHQRKSSSDDSDDSSQTPGRTVNVKTNDSARVDRENVEKVDGNKEKDVIDDLFSKAAKPKELKNNPKEDTVPKRTDSKNQDIFEDLFAKSQNIKKKETVKERKTLEKKIDLFSDNIFDDIDDIFTTNVSKVILKEPSKEQAKKSLFDDDDDTDLFKDVGVNQTESSKKSKRDSIKETINEESQKKKDTKSIFDSDDDLFSDKVNVDTENKTETIKSVNDKVIESQEIVTKTKSDIKNKVKSVNKVTKSIFDDDDEDDIFTNVDVAKRNPVAVTESNARNSVKVVQGSINDDKISKNKTDIFGDNNDDENLFTKKETNSVTPTVDDKLEVVKEKSKAFNSPNLFDDEDDDLFTKPSQNNAIKTNEDKSEKPILGNDTNVLEQNKNHVLSKTDETKESNINIEKQDIYNNEKIEDSLNIENKVEEIVGKTDLTSDASDDWDTEDKETEETPSEINTDIFATKSDNIFKNTTETIKTFMEEDNKISRKNIGESENTSARADLTETDTLRNEKQFNSDISIKNDQNLNVDKHATPSPNFFKKEEDFNKKPDTLNDVFDDLPPVFEKPKEPKRSKNINALFDDDSDDEALFFKKNDVIDDVGDDGEKSDTPFTTGDDLKPDVRLFGLFHDEPPAIDVDFVQKTASAKKDVENPAPDSGKHDIFRDSEEELSPTKTQTLFETKDGYKIQDNLDAADVLDGNKPENDSKKVGKLKPMSLNINVKTLLPGASPKKIPKPVEQPEQPDGQIFSRSNEEFPTETLQTIENTESKMVKSVSFDGEPDSSILDSKLSKERAKIQVKRRPSTRRARREAVKKSGIDFGNDTTDASNDDPNEVTSRSMNYQDNIDNDLDEKMASEINFIEKSIENVSTEQKPDENVTETSTKDVKSKVVYILNDEDIFTETNDASIVKANINKVEAMTSEEQANINEDKTDATTSKIDLSKDKTDNNSKIYDITSNKNVNISEREKSVPTTATSIFDDEDDIFKTMIKETKIKTPVKINIENEKSVTRSTTASIFHDEDDIFKTMIKETKIKTTEASPSDGITTLGKVYSEQTKTETSKPTTAESNDDIFKDTTLKTKERPSIEQRNQKTEQITEESKVKIKETEQIIQKDIQTKSEDLKSKAKSIFDDLSDSETELFGNTKTKDRVEPKKEMKKIKQVSKKQNLFDSDSEDDLFGAKSKTKDKIKKSVEVDTSRSDKKVAEVPAKKIEVKSSLFGNDENDLFSTKPAERRPADSAGNRDMTIESVCDDPLTLLQDDDDQ